MRCSTVFPIERISASPITVDMNENVRVIAASGRVLMPGLIPDLNTQSGLAHVQGSGSATEVKQIGQHSEGIKPRKFHFRLMHKIDYRIANDSLDKTDGDQHSRINENVPYLRRPKQKPKTGDR